MIEHMSLVARAGGGGSGGGDGAAGIIVIPLIIFGIIASWWIRRKRILKAEAKQQLALAKDESWSDAVIEKRVTDVFYKFQKDWSNFKTDSIKNYVTPDYYQHIALMLASLKQMGRRNIMENVTLKKATLFGIQDSADDELDRFDVEIKASANDRLLEEKNHKTLSDNESSFEEIWHFEREGKEWMLDSISQVNRDGIVVNYDPIVDEKYSVFAEANGFFYNADFGWLLMPLHGVLFSDASYGRSDINHHVIGLYHDTLVQFFEYTPLIRDKAGIKEHLQHIYKPRSLVAKYTIAHTTLSKSYSNIIVDRRRNTAFFSFKPIGMTKITLEWPQFNKLFNVYATDIDQVTSLELLHPAFMEKLADLNFRVSLEVIGNDLYLHSTDNSADYQQMLNILKEAFEEMKM